jgi:hypothetical protein
MSSYQCWMVYVQTPATYRKNAQCKPAGPKGPFLRPKCSKNTWNISIRSSRRNHLHKLGKDANKIPLLSISDVGRYARTVRKNTISFLTISDAGRHARTVRKSTIPLLTTSRLANITRVSLHDNHRQLKVHLICLKLLFANQKVRNSKTLLTCSLMALCQMVGLGEI